MSEQGQAKAPEEFRALIVEDDVMLRRLLEKVLTRAGVRAHAAANGEEALAMLEMNEYGLVLLDLMMPKLSGIDVIRFLETHQPAVLRVVVVMTAAPDTLLTRLHATAIHGILRKPFDVETIDSIARSLRREAGMIAIARAELNDEKELN